MGRAGIEPATLGLKGPLNELQQDPPKRKCLQNGTSSFRLAARNPALWRRVPTRTLRAPLTSWSSFKWSAIRSKEFFTERKRPLRSAASVRDREKHPRPGRFRKRSSIFSLQLRIKVPPKGDRRPAFRGSSVFLAAKAREATRGPSRPLGTRSSPQLSQGARGARRAAT